MSFPKAFLLNITHWLLILFVTFACANIIGKFGDLLSTRLGECVYSRAINVTHATHVSAPERGYQLQWGITSFSGDYGACPEAPGRATLFVPEMPEGGDWGTVLTQKDARELLFDIPRKHKHVCYQDSSCRWHWGHERAYQWRPRLRAMLVMVIVYFNVCSCLLSPFAEHSTASAREREASAGWYLKSCHLRLGLFAFCLLVSGTFDAPFRHVECVWREGHAAIVHSPVPGYNLVWRIIDIRDLSYAKHLEALPPESRVIERFVPAPLDDANRRHLLIGGIPAANKNVCTFTPAGKLAWRDAAKQNASFAQWQRPLLVVIMVYCFVVSQW